MLLGSGVEREQWRDCLGGESEVERSRVGAMLLPFL